MQPRTPKNKGRFLLAAIVALWGLGVVCPAPISAAVPTTAPIVWSPDTYRVCPIDRTSDLTNYDSSWNPSPGTPGNMQTYGFTKRIVMCIRDTILFAVASDGTGGRPKGMLILLSEYLATTIALACMLAIALWGVSMAMGRNSAPVKDLFVLGLKIGAVIFFTVNFGGFFPKILDALDYMLGVVAGYVTYTNAALCPTAVADPSLWIWDKVDCALETLVGGIYSATSMKLGILAFAAICLTSGAIGGIVGLGCLLIIAQLLFAIARSLYIFLTSYIAFTLMVLISPIFIPMMLFKVTKSYFEQWVKITAGFLLQPIVLFAYLSMMLAAFDTVVYSGQTSLFRAIAGTVVDGKIPGWTGYTTCVPSWYDTVPVTDWRIGRWLAQTQSFGSRAVGAYSVGVDWNKIRKAVGIGEVDTGVVGDIATTTGTFNWKDAGGIFSLPPFSTSAFPVDASLLAVDFEWLACNRGYDDGSGTQTGDVTRYVVELILSVIMALMTTTIFLKMLDYLPFIGAGLSGDTLAMPPFGAGKLASPGTNLMSKIQSNYQSRFLRKD